MLTQPTIVAANLGMADSLILMVLALVVFGPRRLPMIGRQLGKLMYEFRKASNDFRFQMEEELRSSEDADRRQKEESERQASQPSTPALPSSTASGDSSEGATTSESASTDAIPSPYPGEDVYPAVILPETAVSEQPVAEIPEYITEAAHSPASPEAPHA